MQPPAPPEPLYILRGHRAAVQCTDFFPECDVLAAGDGEGELKLWDLDSRRVIASVSAHQSHAGILQVACPLAHSQHVVSQGRDGVVKVWQVHSGSSIKSEPVQVISAGCYNFCRFALLQQGQTSSSCSTPAAAVGHNNSSHRCSSVRVSTVIEGFQPGSSLDVNSSEHAAAVADTPASLQQQWQQQHCITGLLSTQLSMLQQQQDLLSTVEAGVDLSLSVPGCADSLSGLDVLSQPDLTEEAEENLVKGTCHPSSDAAAAATAGRGSSMADAVNSIAEGGFSDTTAAAAGNGSCLLALPASDCADVGVWQLGSWSTSTSGPHSASRNSSSSSSSGQIMLLKQQRSSDRPGHGLCMAVALLQPQGLPLHVLTGYEDGTVGLWDTRQPKCYLAAARLHTESVMCLAAAPNCKSGFSGSADEQLAAFDLSLCKGQIQLAKQLTVPKAGIADVAIRPDGRIAATAGWDGKIRIWHARRRQPLALLRWHSQQVACVTFSRDCRFLAAGGRDHHISMWSIYPVDDVRDR